MPSSFSGGNEDLRFNADLGVLFTTDIDEWFSKKG